jgi:hypothetical protein
MNTKQHAGMSSHARLGIGKDDLIQFLRRPRGGELRSQSDAEFLGKQSHMPMAAQSVLDSTERRFSFHRL